jgi:ribosomal protein S18
MQKKKKKKKKRKKESLGKNPKPLYYKNLEHIRNTRHISEHNKVNTDASTGVLWVQSLQKPARYPQDPPRDLKTSGVWNTASAPIQSHGT